MRGRGAPTKVDVYILHDGRLSSHAATNGVMKSLGIEAEALECVGSFLRFDRHGHAVSFLTEMQTVGTSSIELHDYLGLSNKPIPYDPDHGLPESPYSNTSHSRGLAKPMIRRTAMVDDLRKDWQRWTTVERVLATLIVAIVLIATPATMLVNM